MKRNRLLLSIVGGAVFAASPLLVPSINAQALTTNLLADTTFDAERPQAWGYGYYYGAQGQFQNPVLAYFDPLDVEMTNSFVLYSFDLTGLDGSTGYGTGFGGPLFRPDPDPELFASSNRVDYIFSWDARVAGLLEGTQTANLEMQVQLYNPDFAPTKVLQVNLGFQAGSNWTHYVRNLEEGGLGDNTSETIFAQAYTNINEVRYNVNVHEPHNFFGFDGDIFTENNLNNSIMLDNLKLEVVVRPASTNPPLPTYTQVIADWNLDDKPLDFSYGGYSWSQKEEYMPTFTYDAAAPGEGVDGSNAWALYMDNSVLVWDPPQWAGGGMGGGGPTDYTQFNTSDLTAYRISFDAKAKGIAGAAANGVLQVFLDAPDDTLQPADENTDADLLARLDFQVGGLTTEFQRYSLTFNKGNAGSGSKDNIAQHFDEVIALRTQWQIENAQSEATWGYDADNAFVIDNILIERIYTGLPEVTISATGDEISVNWGGGTNVKLQTSTNMNDGWTDVATPGNPYTVTPAAGESRFFRTVLAQ